MNWRALFHLFSKEKNQMSFHSNELEKARNERVFWYKEASRIHCEFMKCNDLDLMHRLNKQHELAQVRHLRACANLARMLVGI